MVFNIEFLKVAVSHYLPVPYLRQIAFKKLDAYNLPKYVVERAIKLIPFASCVEFTKLIASTSNLINSQTYLYKKVPNIIVTALLWSFKIFFLSAISMLKFTLQSSCTRFTIKANIHKCKLKVYSYHMAIEAYS